MSITVRMDPAVKRAIAAIPAEAWRTIKYTDAIYDEQSDRWISRAEVAEIPFTGFTSKKAGQVPGRLVVRRIPDIARSRVRGGPLGRDSGEALRLPNPRAPAVTLLALLTPVDFLCSDNLPSRLDFCPLHGSTLAPYHNDCSQ